MERTKRIEVRVSPEERDRLEALAQERGMKLSQYLRMSGLGQLTIEDLARKREVNDPWEAIYGSK